MPAQDGLEARLEERVVRAAGQEFLIEPLLLTFQAVYGPAQQKIGGAS